MNDSTPKSGLDTFEHVVVLMLENRSFDNLLGYLYQPEEVPEGKIFEGLAGKYIQMPVPKIGDVQPPPVEPMRAENYHQPYPDPGEVYQHVNTQIYNFISEGNVGIPAEQMQAPYNIPSPQPSEPTMNGFIKDYINTLSAIDCKKACKHGADTDECKTCKSYKSPDRAQYSRIMQCYHPDQIPVLSTLAKEFAVFDHWHCSVPSQTWCNRAFWHAATSGGRVANPSGLKEMWQWMKDVWSQDTLFTRLYEKSISHAVYTSGPVSVTSLVNGPFRHKNVKYSFEDLSAFKDDINGGNLPQYSFIEPKFLGEHNDQHPSSAGKGGMLHDDGRTKKGTVLLGEALIWDVYNTIRESPYANNTLFIITYDEHGGCFDHLPPPNIKGGASEQKDFSFDRLGIRVPMVMVSAHIKKNTIVNDTHDHCSFLKTMSEKWDFENLTDRDRNAKSFADIFVAEERTLPEIPKPEVELQGDAAFMDDELHDLQKTIILCADAVAKKSTVKMNNAVMVEDLNELETVKQGIDYLEGLKPYLEGMT